MKASFMVLASLPAVLYDSPQKAENTGLRREISKRCWPFYDILKKFVRELNHGTVLERRGVMRRKVDQKENWRPPRFFPFLFYIRLCLYSCSCSRSLVKFERRTPWIFPCSLLYILTLVNENLKGVLPVFFLFSSIYTYAYAYAHTYY